LKIYELNCTKHKQAEHGHNLVIRYEGINGAPCPLCEAVKDQDTDGRFEELKGEIVKLNKEADNKLDGHNQMVADTERMTTELSQSRAHLSDAQDELTTAIEANKELKETLSESQTEVDVVKNELKEMDEAFDSFKKNVDEAQSTTELPDNPQGDGGT